MRTSWQGLLAILLATGAITSQVDAVAAARAETLSALRKAGETEDGARAAAVKVVDLLVAADERVRHAALAVVLLHPEPFVAHMAALHAQLTNSPPDDSVLRALTVVSAAGPLPFDAALRALGSRWSREVERGLRSLACYPTEVLPHLGELAQRLELDQSGSVLRCLQTVHKHHPEQVVAAVERAMQAVRADHRLRFVVVLQGLGVPAARIEAELIELLGVRSGGSVDKLTEMARLDAGLRARLADVCSHAEGPVAAGALEVFGKLGPLAAEHWPKIAPCLRSGALAHAAVRLAVQWRVERPEAVTDVIAVLPTASPDVLATLAWNLLSFGEVALSAVPALAARIPLPDDNTLTVLDVLFALDGHDDLRRVLPGLLVHASPGVRGRACLLAGAIGVETAEERQLLAALATDADAVLRSQAQYVQRLLSGDAADEEMADYLRDRDVHRVLAAWSTVRARSERTSSLDRSGALRLLGTWQFAPWVRRLLMRDLEERRVDVASIADVVQALPSSNSAAFAEELANSPTGRLVLAEVASRPSSAQTRPRLAELAAKNPALRQVFERQGLLQRTDPATAVVPVAPESDAAARGLELLRALGDVDPMVRSRACAELENVLRTAWQVEGKRLRRQGSAAERRCIAALLEPMTALRAIAATRAPEAWVVVRGLEDLRMAKATGAEVHVPDVLRALCDREDVWRLLVNDARLASGFLQDAARLGEQGVPLLRTAMAVPELRGAAIGVMPLLGPAARPFFPDLLRALRTDHRAAAACALLAIGLRPTDPEHASLRTEVEALWREDRYGERRDLLPAVAALGADTGFAADGLKELLARGLPGSFGLQLAASEPLHGWVVLAARADAETQRQIAVLLLASAVMGRFLPQREQSRSVVDDLWSAAGRSAWLHTAMQRAVGSASPDELGELFRLLLDACAAGRPLPATGAILESRPEIVQELLPRHLQQRGWTFGVAQALARSAPTLFLSTIAEQQTHPTLLLAVHDVPRSARVLAKVEELLARPEPVHRALLTRVLVAQGSDALTRVAAELRRGGETADAILAALGAAGADAEFAMPAVRPLMHRDAPRYLDIAMRLGSSGLASLVDVLGPGAALPRLSKAASTSDTRTRCAALRMLADLDPAVAADAARASLRSTDASVRRWASLVLLPVLGGEVDVPSLLPLFEDASPLLRRRALGALAQAEKWGHELGCVATDLLADEDLGVRRAAAQAFAAHPEEITPSLVAMREAAVAETDPELARVLQDLVRGH